MSEIPSLDAARLFSVKGLVVVITGGGTGIGLMFARALAANGASKVYIMGRRLEPLQQAAASLPSPNPIVPLVCDVTSKDSLSAAAKQIESEVGYINVLVNNAGIVGPLVDKLKPDASIQELQEYLWKWDAKEFNQVYEINNSGVFWASVAFLSLLDEGNKRAKAEKPSVPGATKPASQIIITASIASFLRHVVTGFAYVTSKAAAASMTKSLATFLAPHGIRVNAIAPGFFPSEMTDDFLAHLGKRQDDGTILTSSKLVPTQRFGKENDMAGTILYMTSEAGGYLDGCIIVLDGGRLSILPATY